MAPASFHPVARALLTLLLLVFPLPLRAQQVGSFFTAIYLNGAPVASNQYSCSNMGQGGYCCAAGQSCEWDDAGHVACCATGTTCHGTPYSGAAANGQYQAPACNTCQAQCSTCQAQQQTTTVYQQAASPTYNNYNNNNNNNNGGGGGAVVPIVPVTRATVLDSYTPSPFTTTTTYPSYSQPSTTTYTPPLTTTIAGAAGGVIVTTRLPVGQACGGGTYTTLTEANVGTPVRTVGCYVIFNSEGMRTRDGRGAMWWVFWAGAIVSVYIT